MECVQPTIPETEKSTPSRIGFICFGDETDGEFVPSRVHILANTVEVQEAVQGFLQVHGLRNVADAE